MNKCKLSLRNTSLHQTCKHQRDGKSRCTTAILAHLIWRCSRARKSTWCMQVQCYAWASRIGGVCSKQITAVILLSHVNILHVRKSSCCQCDRHTQKKCPCCTAAYTDGRDRMASAQLALSYGWRALCRAVWTGGRSIFGQL